MIEQTWKMKQNTYYEFLAYFLHQIVALISCIFLPKCSFTTTFNQYHLFPFLTNQTIFASKIMFVRIELFFNNLNLLYKKAKPISAHTFFVKSNLIVLSLSLSFVFPLFIQLCFHVANVTVSFLFGGRITCGYNN